MLSILAAVLLAARPVPLSAAGTVPGQAGGPGDPGEPEIVLPPVVLEIEDLSVERVEAKLPPEEDLLPPPRDVLLVDLGEIVIADPSVPTGADGSAGTAAGSRDRLLAADVRLGAGSANHLTGSIALKTLGSQPRFSLDFTHETMDGSTVNPLATGYGRRSDVLSGALVFAPGSFELGLTGSFNEDEAGLQNLTAGGVYATRLARALGGRASISAKPVEQLTLSAALDASVDTLRLDVPGLSPESEYRIAPSLSARASFAAVRLGVDARYAYRSSTPAGGSRLHRVFAGLWFEADLPASLILNGSVGWFGSGSSGAALAASLVPFEVRLTGTPAPFVALSAGGGYRVTQLDMRDAALLSPLLLPAVPVDDSGWFADGSLRLTFTRDLSASARAAFSTAVAAPDAGLTPGPNGLYPLVLRQGNRFTTDLGMRWGITQGISLSASYAREWLALAVLVPSDRLLVELAGLQEAGKWGGNLSVDWTVPQPASGVAVQLPVVGASGFFAMSEIVTLHLGASDLLAPLLAGGTRTGFGGWTEPGLRVTASVRMSF
jgi:hypothetical protein